MSDDEGEQSGHARMILAQRQRVQEVRSQFIGEGVYGNRSETAHLQLARVCVEYWQLLREYEGESVIDGLPDVEPLRDRLGHETKQLQQSSAGLKRGGGYDWRPAVLDVAVEDILELLDQLDDAANKLGFSASATEKLPNDRASEDDLKALLETRGQSEAVDNLPSEQEADG